MSSIIPTPHPSQADLYRSSAELVGDQAKYKNFTTELADMIGRDPLEAAKGLRLSTDKLSYRQLLHKLDKLWGCGTDLELERKPGKGWRLRKGNFCRQGDGCPCCAKQLQRRRVARFSEPFREAAKRFRAYHVVFTVPNSHDLRDRLDFVYSSLKRFRKMGQKGRRGEWSKVEAAVSNIETKRGDGSGLWHPHIHLIAFVPGNQVIDFKADKTAYKLTKNGSVSYHISDPGSGAVKVKASALSLEWIRATGESGINVSCRPIEPTDRETGEVLRPGDPRYEAQFFGSCFEVFHYSVKMKEPEQEAPEWKRKDFAEIMCAMFARRKFTAYGLFRKRYLDPDYARSWGVPLSECGEYKNPLYAGQDDYDFSEPVEGELYSVRWRYDRSAYGEPEKEKRSIFPNEASRNRIDKAYRSVRAKLVGWFRRRHYELLELRPQYAKKRKLWRLNTLLDQNHDRMREACRELADRRRILQKESLGDWKDGSRLWKSKTVAFEAVKKIEYEAERWLASFWKNVSIQEPFSVRQVPAWSAVRA